MNNKLEQEHKELVIQYLNKTYDNNNKELYDTGNYVGFGILIAIFFMSTNFRVQNKCLVLFSSFFAILSLVMSYFSSALHLKESEYILRHFNQNAEDNYRNMVSSSDFPYWTMQGVLVVAVILFCILGYQYFFYIDPDEKKTKLK